VQRLRRSRRIPFGEHPAAGSRFGLRAGPTDQRPSGTARCWRQWQRGSLRIASGRGRRSSLPPGRGDCIGPRSQTKPRNFAFPGLSGPGNAPRVYGIRGASGWGPDPAHALRVAGTNVFDPKPMGASTRTWRKRRGSRTDSSVEQGLEVAVRFIVATRWIGSTTRRQCFPVNAGDRGDGRQLPGRGTLRRVNACEDGFLNPRTTRVACGGIFGFQEA